MSIVILAFVSFVVALIAVAFVTATRERIVIPRRRRHTAPAGEPMIHVPATFKIACREDAHTFTSRTYPVTLAVPARFRTMVDILSPVTSDADARALLSLPGAFVADRLIQRMKKGVTNEALFSLSLPHAQLYFDRLASWLRTVHKVTFLPHDMSGEDSNFGSTLHTLWWQNAPEMYINPSLSPSARLAVLIHESGHLLNHTTSDTPFAPTGPSEAQANQVLRFTFRLMGWPETVSDEFDRTRGMTGHNAITDQFIPESQQIAAKLAAVLLNRTAVPMDIQNEVQERIA